MNGRRLLLLAGIVTLAVATAAPPRERVVPADGIVAVVINGVPLRLRVDPASPSLPILDRTAAWRAGLVGTPGDRRGPTFHYGALDVHTRAGVAVVEIDGRTVRRRAVWLDETRSGDADGSIGPGGLPDPVVRIRLRAPITGERRTVFPAVHERHDDRSDRAWTTYTRMSVAGAPVRVRLEPFRPRTLISAGAGARLARVHGGIVSGAPVATIIQFRAERPTRTLTLRQPVVVGPFALTRLGIRVADYGSAARIAEADAPAEVIDPADIVVIGRSRRIDPRDLISIGADQLANCSSIVFDRSAKRITLTCA